VHSPGKTYTSGIENLKRAFNFQADLLTVNKMIKINTSHKRH